jgi:folylpolyglutamate synthase/dihydropteroate synthase
MKMEKDKITTEIRTLVTDSGLDNDACTALLQQYPGQEVELLQYLKDRFATIKAENDYTVPPLILHVTGTKGKGSTLAMCESIMRNAEGIHP